MNSSAELHKLLRDTLLADSDVMALANGVYDSVPEDRWGAKNAYISIGNSDGVPFDADCAPAAEITFQIDCWSRKKGLVNARLMVDAVRAALTGTEFELTNNALVEMRPTLWRSVLDPDGLTAHGIVQVTAFVEEPEGSA